MGLTYNKAKIRNRKIQLDILIVMKNAITMKFILIKQQQYL